MFKPTPKAGVWLPPKGSDLISPRIWGTPRFNPSCHLLAGFGGNEDVWLWPMVMMPTSNSTANVSFLLIMTY
ncbi:MAG: hypothetical protein IPI31_04795 [Bacteroidetes bacterium]|nr:hypothetical protein [Bacteroidota bacterium]